MYLCDIVQLLGGVSLLLFGVSILTIGVLHLGVPKYRIYLLIAKALLSMALSVCLYLHYSTQLGLWRWLTGCLFAGLGLTPVLSGSCMRLLVSRLLIIPAALPKPIQNLVFPSDLSTNAREKALNRALKHGWEEVRKHSLHTLVFSSSHSPSSSSLFLAMSFKPEFVALALSLSLYIYIYILIDSRSF